MPLVRAGDLRMGLMDSLRRLLYGEERKTAKKDAVSRLKVVLAHDRSGIDELTLAKIRAEIKMVVAKYVTIADEGAQFDVMTDERLTLLTATFPLSPDVRRSSSTSAAASAGGRDGAV